MYAFNPPVATSLYVIEAVSPTLIDQLNRYARKRRLLRRWAYRLERIPEKTDKQIVTLRLVHDLLSTRGLRTPRHG